jgi:hypothetical protein
VVFALKAADQRMSVILRYPEGSLDDPQRAARFFAALRMTKLRFDHFRAFV